MRDRKRQPHSLTFKYAGALHKNNNTLITRSAPKELAEGGRAKPQACQRSDPRTQGTHGRSCLRHAPARPRSRRAAVGSQMFGDPVVMCNNCTTAVRGPPNLKESTPS